MDMASAKGGNGKRQTERFHYCEMMSANPFFNAATRKALPLLIYVVVLQKNNRLVTSITLINTCVASALVGSSVRGTDLKSENLTYVHDVIAITSESS